MFSGLERLMMFMGIYTEKNILGLLKPNVGEK
jgi:hypothetical protein